MTTPRRAIIAADGTFTYDDLDEASKRVAGSLLADTEKQLCEAYGVWQEKSMYGRKYMGVVRTTFLIDPKGKIAHRWDKVKPAEHDAEIVAKLDVLRKN